MTKEKVDEMLKNHVCNKARCAFLRMEIPRLETLLDYIKTHMIEMEVGQTQNLDGMPHGTKISDPTAQLAMRICEEGVTDNVLDVEAELREKRSEYANIKVEVSMVDEWLKGLSPKEIKVVSDKMNGMTWAEIIRDLESEAQILYSYNGVKRIYREGVKKIYAIAR